MCGRFAVGIDIQQVPQVFNQTVLHNEQQGDEHDGVINFNNAQLDTTRAKDWQPSYNIAPTNTALIVYMIDPPKDVDAKYIIESSKFGLVPTWAKPKDSTPTGLNTDHQGKPYSKEIGKQQSRYFNCRRESLTQNQSVWNSCKKHRCVIPIMGYFEWLKSKQDKIPYYIHSSESKLVYLAGFYSHNYNYEDYKNINGEYMSSFTIITVPASKEDSNDLSWLHDRKPMMLEPGSKEWFDWLSPANEWNDSLIDNVLNSTTNKAYQHIEGYTVSKDVGFPGNKSEDIINKVNNKPQSSIHSFFAKNKKVEMKPEKENKSVKLEQKNKTTHTTDNSLNKHKSEDPSDESIAKRIKREHS